MEYIILLVALIVIVLGANNLVEGSVDIAKRFKVPDFVIGAVIIGIGTSMPELVVSSIGAVQGNADIAIGNVVGSNIFNILGILGITAIFFPVSVSKENVKLDIPLCLGISVLATLLAMNFFTGGTPSIGRIDGAVLLVSFGLFMYHSFFRNKGHETAVEETPEVKNRHLWISLLKVFGGLAVLIFGCDMFVDDAIKIAREWGVNDAIISVTLIACGTSLPELAASITAALKKNTQMALGNIIGSNIFNLTLILGLSSQVTPLVSSGIGLTDYLVMIGAVILTFAAGCRGRIGRAGGVVLLVSFILYNWYLISIL